MQNFAQASPHDDPDDRQHSPVRLSSNDGTAVFITTDVILIIVFLLWIGLLVWGWIAYVKVAKHPKPNNPNWVMPTALGTAIGGIFLPLLEIVPIVFSFMYTA